MQHALELLSLLIWPFAACIAIGLLHAYAGLHVLRRGVIFVDLALAQMAALGAVVALFFAPQGTHAQEGIGAPEVHPAPAVARAIDGASSGADVSAVDELELAIQQAAPPPPPPEAGEEDHDAGGLLKLFPIGFALFGAVLLAFGRIGGERVPHEAIIGVIYVVAAATTVLLLSKSPHGREQMEEMLTGKLLFVGRAEVLTTAGLYLGLGVLHVLFFRPFLAISTLAEGASGAGMAVRLWDTLFYAMFAVMVTRSVAVAGVLVVFSFLIIPGACAAMFVESFTRRVWVAWLVACAVSVLGMVVSAAWDLPSGPTVVATFGGALLLSICLRPLVARAKAASSVAGEPAAMRG